MAILKSKSGASYDTKSGKKTSSTGVVSYQNPNTSGRTSDSKGGSSKGIESNALVFDTPAYNAQFGGMTGEAQQKAIKSYSSKNPEMQKQATAFASSFYKPSEAIEAPIVADYSNMTPPAFAAADYTPVNQTSDAFVNSLTAPAQMQTSYDTQVAEAEAAAKKEQGALTKMTEKFNISDQYAKLQKQQGIPQMQKQLQEANIQLAQMQSQYQLQNQSLAQQTIPEPFVIGQQNELQKTAAITIGAQASYVQALQGNLELANHYVDKMTELQYQDFQVKYENQKYNLEIAQNYLTKAEAKQAKAMDFQLDMYKMNYSSFLDNKNQIWKNALSQGASSSELQSIARSQSDDDLAWAGQKYGKEAGGGSSNQSIDNERALLSQFRGEQIVKDYNDILGQKGTMDAFIQNGVGGPADLAMVFSFMKGLDPTSVVRESEYETASKSGNIFQGAFAKYNGYFKAKGGFLPQNVKKEFQNLVNQKLAVKSAQYDNVKKSYEDLATRQNLNPENVTINYEAGGYTPPEDKEGDIYDSVISQPSGYWSKLWSSLLGK